MKVLLVVYDNGSYVHQPPIALTYVATAIRNAGHEVKVYSQDLYHLPDSHLTDYLTKNRFDVVGLSLVAGYYPYRKMLSISKAIQNVPNRPFYILGGHGPSPEPEYYLHKSGVDCVVIGEGELTIVELLDAVEHHSPLSTVKGIAYLDSERFVQTARRGLIQDLDSIPFPSWDLFPMDYYLMYRIGNISLPQDRVAQCLSGRGCPFHCNFCYRMDEGSRLRSPENIIEELSILKKDYHVNSVLFQDELLMTSRARTEKICHAFIKAKLDIKWGCNGRLNFAKPDLMRLMKESGCVFINYGIESVDDTALRNMDKALTVKQIVTGIEATVSEGIHPGYNIIFGNIGETKDNLLKDVAFLLKYDDQGQMRTIRPVTPYPGSPLYYYAIEKGLLKDCADFYENKHLNQDLPSVNFTDLSDTEYREALYEANRILLNHYWDVQKKKSEETCRNLYLKQDLSFRGFRQT